jgi:putative PIN family toxin of toxin-antitoxin system
VIRAVLDTNAIVSGIFIAGGIPNQLLRAVQAQVFQLVASDALVDEVVRTLQRDRMRLRYNTTPEQTRRVRALLEQTSLMVAPGGNVQGVATHPEGDLIIATALPGGGDYLVTGDHQLQKLGKYQSVTILSPRGFREVLLAQDPDRGSNVCV